MQVTTLNPNNCTHVYYKRLLEGEKLLNGPLRFNELIETLRFEGENPPTANFKLHVCSLINGYKADKFKKLEDCTLLFYYCQRHQIPLWSQRDFGYGGYLAFPNNPVILDGYLPLLSALEFSIKRFEATNLDRDQLETCFEMAMACGRWNVDRYLIGHFRYGMHICSVVGGKSWPYLTVPCRSGDLEGVRIFLDAPKHEAYHFKNWNHPPKDIKRPEHTKYRHISIFD